ncbi:SCO4402 family protein [Rickettsia tamurae]|uniref:SCO4402 family protein n=1 Tax=Rickettsia tamurae TaxID=334545 RepID=UPI003977EB48
MKDAFEELADFEKQQKTWPKNSEKHPHSYWDSLMFYVLENLYNDCELHEYKPENIGELFYNEEEAKQVYEFCKWFNKLTENIGENQPDAAYLNHPEWHRVYSGAKKLFELMDKNKNIILVKSMQFIIKHNRKKLMEKNNNLMF